MSPVCWGQALGQRFLHCAVCRQLCLSECCLSCTQVPALLKNGICVMHSAERQLESCSRTCRGGSKQSEFSDAGWCLARQKGCSEEACPLPVRGHSRSLRICYLVFAQWQQCYHDTFAAQNACANNPLSSFHHSWAPNAPVMYLVHLHRIFSWPSPKRTSLQLSWKCFSSVLCMSIHFSAEQILNSLLPVMEFTGLPSPGARTGDTWGLRNQHDSDMKNGHGPVPKMVELISVS